MNSVKLAYNRRFLYTAVKQVRTTLMLEQRIVLHSKLRALGFILIMEYGI